MGSYILVIDTETTADPIQQLNFGCFRYCYVDGAKVSTLAEGLIYSDDLPTREPEFFQVLQDYVSEQAPDIDIRFRAREPDRRLSLYSRDEFADRYLWRVGYKQKATIVGFNLPFDISRLAVNVGEARGDYRGGFSYTMWRRLDGRTNTFRPRLCIRMLDSKKSFIGFTAIDTEPEVYAGDFVDLRTLTFALTNSSHSLASACRVFEVEHGKTQATEHGKVTPEYIDYCRRDVLATTELYVAAMLEFATHPIDLDAAKAFSPASIAKAYFRAMNIPKPLQRGSIPPQVLGYAMSAFYGARAECHIRRQPVPVALVDFTSMYPTVNTLMRLWDVLTADQVGYSHATGRVQELLDHVTLETCFDPDMWPQMVGIAKIRADGEIVPVRSKYGRGSWNIGVNVLTSDDDQWFAIPDLVASVLLTGKAPKILDAIVIYGHGRSRKLRPTSLRGTVDVDPTTQDLFPFIVEQRATMKETPTGDFLKVLANSGCYGIFAELNKRELTVEQDITMFGSEEWTVKGNVVEQPGPYTFPPIASCITAAARLMLAMLERCVTDMGGSWALTDTDSMAIVAEERTHDYDGYRSIGYDDVDDIRERFAKLNPYENIPDLLKLEYRGYVYSISAKRYSLYHLDNGTVVIDKYSQHGLGHLLNPTDTDSPDRQWIAQLWQYLIEQNLGLPATEPTWIDRPALSRYSVSQPSLLRSFTKYNEGKPYSQTIKPSNFILIAHPHKMQPTARDKRLLPIAPYESDPRRWSEMMWINKHNRDRTFRISTLSDMLELQPGVVYVLSYRDVILEYGYHTEDKFNQSDGTPCQPNYRGRLVRKDVRSMGTVYLGKEANEVEQVQLGLFSADEVTTERRPDYWLKLFPLVMGVIGHMSAGEIGRRTRIPRSTAKHIVAGRRPSPQHERLLIRLAAMVAADSLGIQYKPDADPLIVLLQTSDNAGRGMAP